MRSALRSTGFLTIAFLFAAAGIVAGVALNSGGDGAGGRLPAPDVPQDAEATDQGIRLHISAAAFSGSGTFLQVSAEVTGHGENIARLRIPKTAFASRSLTPAMDGEVSLVPGRSGYYRFTPLMDHAAAAVVVTEMELVEADGGREVVKGSWILDLAIPGDIGERLRLEHLRGDTVASTGIIIAIEGAVRSTTETLVTIRVDSDTPVEHIGQPRMQSANETLYGGLTATHEGGRLLTYAFPPTAFGSDVEVSFGPFAAQTATDPGSVTVDLASVMERLDHEKTAAILDTDVVARSGGRLDPRQIRFDDICGPAWQVGGTCAYIEFEGIRDEGAWSASDAGGRPLDDVHVVATGYYKDPTGAITGSSTDLRYHTFNVDELRTTVTFWYEGATAETIRGDWTITLTP